MTRTAETVAGALMLVAASTTAAPATNAEIENLAFKTYLYARLGDKDNALEYGNRVLEQRPGHPGVLLSLASLWEADHDAERLIDTAERLLAVIPGDDRALFFKASADFLLRRYAMARESLLQNRRLNFDSRRPFPYNTTLAAAAARAGDWRTALYAHERLTEDGGAYESIAANRRIYDELMRKHHRVATVSADLTAAPGRHRVLLLETAAEANVSVRTRVSASASTGDTALVHGDGWDGARRERTSGRVGVTYEAAPEWTLETTLGADDRGEPDATLGITRSPSSKTRLGLLGYRNLTAYDDAPYAIADIRRTGLTASCDTLFTERTGCRLSGGPRSLHTAGAAPDDWGWIFSGEIHHHLRQRTPRFTVYGQSLWISNPDNPEVSTILGEQRTDALPVDISGTFDLEKAGLRTEIPLKGRVTLGSDLYAGTSLKEQGFLYGASSELGWRPIKTLTLRAYCGWDKGTVLNTFPAGIVRAGLSAHWYF